MPCIYYYYQMYLLLGVAAAAACSIVVSSHHGSPCRICMLLLGTSSLSSSLLLCDFEMSGSREYDPCTVVQIHRLSFFFTLRHPDRHAIFSTEPVILFILLFLPWLDKVNACQKVFTPDWFSCSLSSLLICLLSLSQ